MAGINSTVRITDGMSPALKSMNKALNIVLNSFEKLQDVSANSIDTSDIRDARAELTNAAIAVNKLEQELEQAGDKQERFTREVKNSDSAMSGLVRSVGGLIATYASFQTLMGAVNLSDQLTQAESRLGLVAKQSGDSVEELTDKIMASANNSRAAYLSTASTVASFAQRAGDSFKDANGKLDMDQVIAFSETLNKMYVIAGATAEEQYSSMLQLTQALGSGVLRGEEFNAVFEAAPNVMQEVAEYMGVPIGQLREMASEGQITADIVKNAIFSAVDDVNRDFESMNMTWSQVMTLFKNKAIKALDPILRKINELANNEDVVNFTNGLISAIGTVGTILLWVFELFATVGSFMYENWAFISPIIYGVAAALGVYYGYLLLTKAAEMLSAGIKIVSAVASYALAAATGTQASATAVATAAQYGLNTALLACPLTWIILLIIVLIAAIYLAVAAFNKLSGTSLSATGLIAGSFMAIGALITNILLALLDLVLGVVNYWYNIFGAFANFFANVFNDPVASIIYLFGDLADAVLGVLETIAKAIDKLFGSDLASAVSGWRSGLDSLVEGAVAKHGNGSYEKVMDEINLSSESFGLERWAYSDAFDTGYEWGAGVEDSISGGLKNLTSGSYSPTSTPYEDLVGNVGDIAGNTGSMADSMGTSEEELKYLRDVAEQEAINRFTTAEIKIDMQNNNTIGSNMDIDGIVSSLEDRLYESMEIAAEGV